jgi:ribonuclease BN (tRNA processing enzyme)
MNPGEIVSVRNRKFEMIPVNHTVPAVAYRVESAKGVFAFSGDSTSNISFWDALNARKRLDLLIMETAFSNEDLELSRLSKHYCPSLLIEDIKKLRHRPEIWISHGKPGVEDTIFKELKAVLRGWNLKRIKGKEVFEF